MNLNTKRFKDAEDRFNSRKLIRNRNVRMIGENRFLEIDDPKRVEKCLIRNKISKADIKDVMRFSEPGIPKISEMVDGKPEPFALERILGTNDLIGIAFLDAGLRVARSVGRVWVDICGGSPHGFGTGFMISPRLMITNHHVLENPDIASSSLIEFDYQISPEGKPLPTRIFSFDPGVFFHTDEHLDYTVVAVKPGTASDHDLSAYGWNPLIEELGKIIIPMKMNIIQHPNGEVKKLALRENQLIDLDEDFLIYQTDTAPGSSGSPVYNDQWEVVALHHSGVYDKNAAGEPLTIDGQVWRDGMGEHRIKWIANEGVRVSRIVANLRSQLANQAEKDLFEQIFTAPPFSHEKLSKHDAGPIPSQSATNQPILSSDGSATWTIPLSVSVRVGGTGTPMVFASQASKTVSPVPATIGVDSDLNAKLEAAKREFGSREDVLDVKLGYVFKNGRITDERAIVVTVLKKSPLAGLAKNRITPLPATFMGTRVSVSNPTPEELIWNKLDTATAKEIFSNFAIQPEEIKYTKPTNVSLTKITEPMHVVAHVSPDSGWPLLSEFLKKTKKYLTVGMFDFGAPHILETVKTAGEKASFNEMTLVIQKSESVGEGTKANDLKDEDVVEKLSDALGEKFKHTWVKIGKTNGWIASSYHIKVAVRDHKAFWLSSGNWQSSNQPDATPLLDDPPEKTWLKKYNREWHVIVEHADLAEVFEKHILHDYINNPPLEEDEMLKLPILIMPEEIGLVSPAEVLEHFKYFEPFDEDRVFTVTPLLTPDNYHQEVLDLINSAQEEILIQNQTFNAPKTGDHDLAELVDAVLRKQQAGIRVRIIFRSFISSVVRQNLSNLKDYGFDTDFIKAQKNCHTKGIIVDREKVLLGSQNWSNQGVSINRDASLLFEDEPLAKYFAKIFEHDWENCATEIVQTDELAIEMLSKEGKVPQGMVRFSWKDYLEMM